MGLNDGLRDVERIGVVCISPRREEVDDFLAREGDEGRPMLITLELRRRGLRERPGDEGILSGFPLGDLTEGDCGSGVLAEVWIERRLNE